MLITDIYKLKKKDLINFYLCNLIGKNSKIKIDVKEEKILKDIIYKFENLFYIQFYNLETNKILYIIEITNNILKIYKNILENFELYIVSDILENKFSFYTHKNGLDIIFKENYELVSTKKIILKN